MLKQTFLRTLAVLAVSAVCNLRAEEKGGPAPAPTPAPAPAENKPLTGKVHVVMETSKGVIELELDADKAPISVNNFANYVRKGHYEGTIFHRVIPEFMIQGGGFTKDMEQKPTDKPITNESKNGLSNKRGTIAMARTPEPNSATSQFFINVADNDRLDDGAGYAVFGKVTKGMNVVDAIVSAPTKSVDRYENVPADPITINKVTISQ